MSLLFSQKWGTRSVLSDICFNLSWFKSHIHPDSSLLRLNLCFLCLCRCHQTIARTVISAHLQSLWVQTWLTTGGITQCRVHLKDLSQWTREVSTETLVFSLPSDSNDPNMSSHTLETSWNIADAESRTGSTGTRLRLFSWGWWISSSRKVLRRLFRLMSWCTFC